MIKLTNVGKTYRTGGDSVHALKKINLKIGSGEFVVIVGPSGSGKSTLLHLIGGLDKPTSGEINVNGENLLKLKDRDLSAYRNREIGFVFQDFFLSPNLNLRENTALPLFFNKSKKMRGSTIRNKSTEMLEELFLSDRMKHLPGQVSGGQKQRAAIARALINSPKILLADEPTGNLDSVTGKKIIKLLKHIHDKKGMTLVVVTHDPDIAKYAGRTIEIKDGELKENRIFRNAAKPKLTHANS